MKKEYDNDHLIYFLEKTTPYQRMVWLKKAFNFWKLMQKSQIVPDAVKDGPDRGGSVRHAEKSPKHP